jgi:hypothetical protein
MFSPDLSPKRPPLVSEMRSSVLSKDLRPPYSPALAGPSGPPPFPSLERKHPLEDHPSSADPIAEGRGYGIGRLGGDSPSAKGEDSQAWSTCARVVREYDNQLIQSWRSDMDTTLLFVSIEVSFTFLFS